MGVAPYRRFTIGWLDVPYDGYSETVSFEAVLHETGRIPGRANRGDAEYMADGGVWGEPFSALVFPDEQGRYREIVGSRGSTWELVLEMSRDSGGLKGGFPESRNRELHTTMQGTSG